MNFSKKKNDTLQDEIDEWVWYSRRVNFYLSRQCEHIRNSTMSQEHRRPFNPRVTTLLPEAIIQCIFCKGVHLLHRSSQFFALPVSKRIDFVKIKKLCLNCMSNMHQINICCSLNKCRHCSKLHPTLLHRMFESHSNGNLWGTERTQNQTVSSIYTSWATECSFASWFDYWPVAQWK